MKTGVINMEIFDNTTAIKQAGGNTELARDLFTMLLKELPEHRASIQQALNSHQSSLSDCNIFWDSVHKLHGATAYLGIPALRNSCKELEDHIKQRHHKDIENAVAQLLQQIDKLSAVGREILSQNWDEIG